MSASRPPGPAACQSGRSRGIRQRATPGSPLPAGQLAGALGDELTSLLGQEVPRTGDPLDLERRRVSLVAAQGDGAAERAGERKLVGEGGEAPRVEPVALRRPGVRDREREQEAQALRAPDPEQEADERPPVVPEVADPLRAELVEEGDERIGETLLLEPARRR